MNSLKRLLPLIVLVLLLAACGGAEERKSVYMAKGVELFEAGNYDKARLEFKNVLQIDPKDAEARYMLGQTFEMTQQWRQAAANYAAALEEDPTHRGALSKLGQIYLLARNTDKVNEHIEKLLAQDPKDANALALRAGLAALDGNLEAARADAEAALASEPGHANSSALLASIYMESGDYPRAIEVLEAAHEKDPSRQSIIAVLARVYAQSGDVDKAVETYQRIVAMAPEEVSHRAGLARFLLENGRKDQAAEVLLKAVDELDSDEARLAYADFVLKQDSVDAAEEVLKGYIAANPDSSRLRFSLGKLYDASGKNDEAAAIYQAVVDEFASDEPVRLEALSKLAYVAGRAKDYARARELAEQVLKDNPRAADALKLRGSLALQDGDTSAAIADFRAALAEDASAADTLRLLAKAHFANGEKALGRDALEKAAEANPANFAVRQELAQYYTEEKSYDQALKQLEAMTRIEPQRREPYEAIYKIQVFQENWTAATETADRIKTAFPQDPSGYYLAGLVLQSQNQLEDSVQQFESALAVAPDAVQPLTRLVKSFIALKQFDRAEKRLVEVLDRNEENFVARNLLGELRLGTRRPEEAVEDFGKALELNPGWAIPYRNLATALIALKREDEVAAVMTKGIEETKGSTLLVTTYATYLEKNGKLDSAIEQYESMLAKNPESALAANNLAMLLIEYRDDEASRTKARELTRLLDGSTNPAYLDTVGWVEYQFGDYDRALSALEKAVEGAPDQAIMRYHLGMAYLAKGDEVAARDHLQQALDASQEFKGADEARTALERIGAG